MISRVLARISESRFCSHDRFYFHTILGLEFSTLNEKLLVRNLSNIKFERINQDILSRPEFDSLLDELVFMTGESGVAAQREIFSNFFKAGNICFVARKNDVLIGYYWAFLNQHIITYDDYKKKNIAIELSPNMIFFGNGFIHPEYRLKGVFPHFASYCIKQFPIGSRFITATDLDNHNSFNSHKRLGFVKSFQLSCLTIGHLQWHIIRNEKRFSIKFHSYSKDRAMVKIKADILLPDQAWALSHVIS
ncbi:MAG: hypothetical protein HYV97_14935 [Bdellovibrio sp.]|nr:hypothetical protein [Bdellovibrio sp.]